MKGYTPLRNPYHYGARYYDPHRTLDAARSSRPER